MATYRRVLVYDTNPGGVIRLLRAGSVTVHDATGIDPVAAGTGPVLFTTPAADGVVAFTATPTTVDLVSPNGFVERVTSAESLAESAASAALSASIAQDAASSLSPIGYDTDGTPYLTDIATDLIAYDTDGVPYIAL